MSKFGEIISNAKNQNTVKPESKNTRKPEAKREVREESVNLSVKVPASLRRHWVAEAKRQGISVTSVIIESLNKKFGEP